eukprot:CAMPEP_0168313874 /NCGR_PEP_ID=MMETSP0210-20121227/5022_1 /TAXON_ID=40633 /ORGANISM="Condylostoma magnum, Strain COL2" /LENGTH=60 /DNA_ID=CAMNT_0008276157 /DNA_START=13 /DNA_END=195 /DNA_ORIENTATION=+
MSDLNLSLIGNSGFNALVESGGKIVWCCMPRFDSEPIFNTLLNCDSDDAGFTDIMIADFK